MRNHRTQSNKRLSTRSVTAAALASPSKEDLLAGRRHTAINAASLQRPSKVVRDVAKEATKLDQEPDVPQQSPERYDFSETVTILKNTHKLMVNARLDELEREEDPAKNLQHFVNFTTVEDFINDMVKPMLKQIPLLDGQLNEVRRSVSDVKLQVAQTRADIAQIRQIALDLQNLDKAFCEQKAQCQGDQIFLKQTVATYNTELKECLDLVNTNSDKVYHQVERLNAQDARIRAFADQILAGHGQLERVFEERFKQFGRDCTSLEEVVAGVRDAERLRETRMAELEKYVKDSVDATIGDLFKRIKADEERYQDLQRRVKAQEKRDAAVKALSNNVDTLMADHSQAQSQAGLLSQSMPVLIHLHICEALSRVLDGKHDVSLGTFEREKLHEIATYVTKHSSPRCVKFMHERLLAFMKHYSAEDKGVLPFVYGRHVHKQMTPHELSYIPKSLQLALTERHESLLARQGSFNEAWEQVCLEKARRSDAVLRHKVRALTSSQVAELHQMAIAHKVLVHGVLDDVTVCSVDDKIEGKDALHDLKGALQRNVAPLATALKV